MTCAPEDKNGWNSVWCFFKSQGAVSALNWVSHWVLNSQSRNDFMTAGSSWQHQNAESWTLFWYSVIHLCLVTKISCSAIRVLPEETIYSTYARQTYKSKILKHILQNEYATHIIESASFRLRKEWTIELPNQFGEKKFRNHPIVCLLYTSPSPRD